MSAWGDAEERLTPAARELLDELLADIRRQTILGADRRAIAGEISVRDIVEAFERESNRSERSLIYSRRARRLATIAIVYTFLGATIAALTLAYGLATDQTLSIASLTSGGAALISGFVTMYIALLQRRRAAEQAVFDRLTSHATTDFITGWLKFESRVRLSAARLLGQSTSEKPLGQIVAALAKADLISDSELSAIREMIDVRNRAVHGIEVQDSTLIEVNQQMRRLEKISKRLEDRVA